jgi:hypothetical protein
VWCHGCERNFNGTRAFWVHVGHRANSHKTCARGIGSITTLDPRGAGVLGTVKTVTVDVSQGGQRVSERAGDRAHNRPDASGQRHDMHGDPGNLGHGDSDHDHDGSVSSGCPGDSEGDCQPMPIRGLPHTRMLLLAARTSGDFSALDPVLQPGVGPGGVPFKPFYPVPDTVVGLEEDISMTKVCTRTEAEAMLIADRTSMSDRSGSDLLGSMHANPCLGAVTPSRRTTAFIDRYGTYSHQGNGGGYYPVAPRYTYLIIRVRTYMYLYIRIHTYTHLHIPIFPPLYMFSW